MHVIPILVFIITILVFTIGIFVFLITFSILGPSSGGCWVTDTDPAAMATGDTPTQGDNVVAIAPL